MKTTATRATLEAEATTSSSSRILRIKGLTHLHEDQFELHGIRERKMDTELIRDSLDGASDELIDKILHLVYRHDITELLADRISGI